MVSDVSCPFSWTFAYLSLWKQPPIRKRCLIWKRSLYPPSFMVRSKHVLWTCCLEALSWELWAVSLDEVQEAQCQCAGLQRWDVNLSGLSSSWMTLLRTERSLCLKWMMNISRTLKDLSFSSSVLSNCNPFLFWSICNIYCIFFTLLKHWSLSSQPWELEVFTFNWKLSFKWNHIVPHHQNHRHILAEFVL